MNPAQDSLKSYMERESIHIPMGTRMRDFGKICLMERVFTVRLKGMFTRGI